jgi:IS4 transposase
VNRNNVNSTASKFGVFHQICNLIPPHLVSRLAREHESEADARTFSHWSHVVALLFGKFTHHFGLNNLCDLLTEHRGPLSAIRGAVPPRRNTLSHANQKRPAAIAQDLFYQVLSHLRHNSPGFGSRRFPGRLKKLKGAIHLVDSTVIELVAHCLDWASHRRRKAAVKCHTRLDFQSLLPGYVVVDTAREHDSCRARELCAGLKTGEFVIFDRGYVDFAHFQDLSHRGVFWVTRTKSGMQCDLWEERSVGLEGKILADHTVLLTNGLLARRIRAWVELDGQERELEFLTNQMTLAASTIAELYRARWAIEIFFKELKQTCKLCDLMSYSANGIRWEVWTALLAQLLLRYLAWCSQWGHAFNRLYILAAGLLWARRDIIGVLRSYGTAGGCFRLLARADQAYLPGFG